MSRATIAALLLLCTCKCIAYIDTSTYIPVRLDTFAGSMHSITGGKLLWLLWLPLLLINDRLERFFGFKQGGFIGFDMNCTGETGRLLLVALSQKQYNDVSERPASVW